MSKYYKPKRSERYEWRNGLRDDDNEREIGKGKIFIADGVTIIIRKLREVRQGYEIWRIDVTFYSMKPEIDKVKKDYEIWATVEFIEDFLRIAKSPTKKQVKKFAFEIIKKRFGESNNHIPKEYGVFCSNKTGIRLVKQGGTLVSFFDDIKSTLKRKK